MECNVFKERRKPPDEYTIQNVRYKTFYSMTSLPLSKSFVE